MVNNMTVKLTLSLFILCIMPYEANAFFKVTGQPQQHTLASVSHSKALQAATPVVVDVGQDSVEFVSGQGTHLPLNIALRIILPTGWKIGEKSQNSLLSKKISWNVSNESLRDALEQIGGNEQVRFFINWDKKEVSVLPLKTVNKPVVAKLPLSRPVAVNSTPNVNHTAPAWELEPGSLRKQLEIWCKENNWTMVWTSSLADYILPVSATFTGEFKAIVHEVFLVIRKTSNCALKPKFHVGNHIVEVRDI